MNDLTAKQKTILKFSLQAHQGILLGNLNGIENLKNELESKDKNLNKNESADYQELIDAEKVIEADLEVISNLADKFDIDLITNNND